MSSGSPNEPNQAHHQIHSLLKVADMFDSRVAVDFTRVHSEMTAAEGFKWGERLPTLHGTGQLLRALDTTDAAALLEVFGDREVAGAAIALAACPGDDAFPVAPPDPSEGGNPAAPTSDSPSNQLVVIGNEQARRHRPRSVRPRKLGS
jgi:hypothetical protein